MSHKHINGQERDFIAESVHKGESLRKIAAQLKRHPSTISREIRRNSVRKQYHALTAQGKADERRRGHPPLKMDDPELAGRVKEKLRKDHSPEYISGRLQILAKKLNIGRQTIYNWINREREKGRKWHRYLPRKGKPYTCRKSGIARVRGQKPINERPAEVAERSRLGDWEADTLDGRKGGMAVVPVVERRSRYVVLCPVKDRSADSLNEAIRERFAWQRHFPRHTLTVDQGREFADGERLGKVFKAEVFYTDPHSPWQKGTVEQTNGLLRRYLPKGFDKISDDTLALAEERLNHRPRKCLGFRTPHEVLFGLEPQ